MEVSQYKNKLYSGFLPLLTCILFIFLLLTNPVNSSKLVMDGLTTWCTKMIPSLFPFMVLSGFLLRTGLSLRLSNLLYPLLGFLFGLSPNCIYVIFMGFLCGFPMGASLVAESLTFQKITRREADLLLSFCNNIGPIYIISFAFTTCPQPYSLGVTLCVMYLIPLSYGLILRYTKYKDIPRYHSPRMPRHKKTRTQSRIYGTNNSYSYSGSHSSAQLYMPYGQALQESLQKAITSILVLGGYMVIFNVLQLPFYNSFYQLEEPYINILKGILEISSGIFSLAPYPEFYPIVYTLFLPFCGLCCLFQTYAMIKDTPLSLTTYLNSKIILTLITILVYGLIHLFC